jgi:HNH endonuclease
MYLNLTVEQLFYLKKDLEEFEEIYSADSVEHFIGCYELDPETICLYNNLDSLQSMLGKCDFVINHPLAPYGLISIATQIYNVLINAINWKINHQKYKLELKNKRKEFNKIRNSLFEKLILIQGNFCKICNIDSNLVVDHINPLSKTGTNDLDNLQILCSSCNSKKGNR